MRRFRIGLPSPAMVVALVALSVAMGGTGYAANGIITQDGSGHAAAKHKGKKKKKKSKHNTPVLTIAQRNAIIALIAQFAPKPVNGQNGQNGAPGAPGGPGSTVITRVRLTGPVQTTSHTSASCDPNNSQFACSPDASQGSALPLAGNSWTQAANQINQFFGQVVVTAPDAGTCTAVSKFASNPPSTTPGSMSGEIDDPTSATPLATFSYPGFAYFAASAGTHTVVLAVPTIFEPGSAASHSLTVKVADNCGSGGGAATEHYIVNSFALDPVGIS